MAVNWMCFYDIPVMGMATNFGFYCCKFMHSKRRIYVWENLRGVFPTMQYKCAVYIEPSSFFFLKHENKYVITRCALDLADRNMLT